MNEHGFIRSIHRLLPSEVYRWKISDKFTSGVPDVYYEGTKGILWVEYKYLKNLPKKDTTPIKIGLSELQIRWLNRAVDNRIAAAVVIGHEGKCNILSNKQWTLPLIKQYYIKQAVDIRYLVHHIQTSVN